MTNAALPIAENHTRENTSGSSCPVMLGDAHFFLDCSGLLIWPDEGLLVVSDLHLEKASSYGRRGTFLPPYDSQRTLESLSHAILRHNPSHVISLGDSVHDIGGWERLSDQCRFLLDGMMKDRKWTWVSGNHDPQKPKDFPGHSADSLYFGSISFRHEPAKTLNDGEIEICGHLHPAARISSRGKSLRRSCFVSDGKRLIMPAFGALTGGLDIKSAAYKGLLDPARMRVFMLGERRVHAILPNKL